MPDLSTREIKEPKFSFNSPLSNSFKFWYFLRVFQKTFFRFIRWYIGFEKFSLKKEERLLEFRIFKHQSKLIKKLGNSEMQWQYNKIRNLEIAIPLLTGILIQPGETFSIWRIIGKPSQKKGYLEGMELSRGKARGGIGGGLCQLSNLIHWIVLHSDLKVKDRSQHSFDPFPDQGRVLPYGTGAALFYNYIDLFVYNPTSHIFQINLWIHNGLLEGEIRSNKQPSIKYKIYQKNHYFFKKGSDTFRTNEIWRDKFTKGHSSQLTHSEMLYKNCVKVMY